MFDALAQTGAGIIFTLEPQAVAASLRNRRWLNMTKALSEKPDTVPRRCSMRGCVAAFNTR